MIIRAHRPGFTIVELLIVVVVIAILATLSIMSFNGVQRSAGETQLKAELSQAAKQLAVANIQSGSYPSNMDGIKTGAGFAFQYTHTPETNAYCMTASNLWAEYYVTNDNPAPVSGVCPGHTSAHTITWTAVATSGTENGVGSYSSCGIVNGKLYCWGGGGYGRLGNGSTTASNTPVAVSTSLMSGTVTKVVVGGGHVCAIADGQAYCWGYSWTGQLGDGGPVWGASTNANAPVAVSTSLMSGTVTDISVADDHSCAVTSGSAYCWGAGDWGKLGNGATSLSSTPVAVSTSLMSGTVTDISTGYGHSCAISGGAAYCWGLGGYGQLGNSANSSSNTPVAVSTSLMSGTVTDISSSSNHSCAVSGGSVYCWGANNYGQLGNSTNDNSNTPVAVVGISGTATSVSVGEQHSCAVTSAGQAYCWGGDNNGKLGDDVEYLSVNSAVLVNSSVTGATISTIYAGNSNACAISNSRAYCWGSNAQGQLGDNSGTGSPIPVLVANP